MNRVVRSTSVPIADQVALPVAGHGPVLDIGRALTDQDLRDHERLASAATAGTGNSQRPAGAQACHQLAAQGAAALDVEGLVDGLVRDPHGRIIGVVDAESVGDLLRAP